MTLQARAGDLIGTTWVEGGRNVERDGGVDCYGVLVELLGLPENASEALASKHAIANAVPEGEACKAGDILILDGSGESHVGVVLDAFEFVHAIRDVGVAKGKISLWTVKQRVRLKENAR